MPNPILQLQLQALYQGVLETSEDLFRDLGGFVSDFLGAFPNPLAMVDVTVRFWTGIPGRLVGIPFSGLRRIGKHYVELAGLKHTVIKTPDAVALPYTQLESFIRFVTFTGESGLLSVIATWAARFTWNAFKGIRRLIQILGAKSELELVEIFTDALTKRIVLFRIAGAILGFVALFCLVGAQLLMLGFGTMLVSGEFQKIPLFQGHPREKQKTTIRRRIGGVKP